MKVELPSGLLRSVTPNDLRSYARAKGWERVEGIRGAYVVYRWPGGDLDQLIVPNQTQGDDYERRVEEAVWKLAEIEGLPTGRILSSILNHDADVVRVRIDGDRSSAGSLPLLEAVSVFDGVKRSLLAAAHSVLHPRRWHPRLSRREAEAMLRACRFEQTEQGSFVVAVSCPLRAADDPQETVFGPKDSFTRATTRYLSLSLEALSQSIRADGGQSITAPKNEEGVPSVDDKVVLSANMCDALLRMRPEQGPATVDISISWAPSKPLNGSATGSSVHFEADDFDAIENTYLQLQPTTNQDSSDLFVAIVDELRGSLNRDDKREGDVTLSVYLRESDELVRARAELSPSWYQVADEAHMSGKYVLVKGVIRRGRRVSRLAEISQFDLIQESQ